MKTIFAALLVIALTATAAATAPFAPLAGVTTTTLVVQVQGKKETPKKKAVKKASPTTAPRCPPGYVRCIVGGCAMNVQFCGK